QKLVDNTRRNENHANLIRGAILTALVGSIAFLLTYRLSTVHPQTPCAATRRPPASCSGAAYLSVPDLRGTKVQGPNPRALGVTGLGRAPLVLSARLAVGRRSAPTAADATAPERTVAGAEMARGPSAARRSAGCPAD